VRFQQFACIGVLFKAVSVSVFMSVCTCACFAICSSVIQASW